MRTFLIRFSWWKLCKKSYFKHTPWSIT